MRRTRRFEQHSIKHFFKMFSHVMHVACLSNLLSARSLLSHTHIGISIEDAARDGPCAHGKLRVRCAAFAGFSGFRALL